MTCPIVCPRCRRLYAAPEGIDYFGLLGLPRGFAVDAKAVQERYVTLAREVHPDFHLAADVEVQQLALSLSALVNEAARTLRDPVLRAEYVLRLAGGPDSAADKSVPDGFLLETMTLREEIEEAIAAQDSPALRALADRVSKQRDASLAAIGALAEPIARDGGGELSALRRELNVLKYHEKQGERLAAGSSWSATT